MQLVALGNPHFSLAECARLGELCRSATARGEAKHAGVTFVVTTGRQTLAAAREAGYVAAHMQRAFLTPSLNLTLTITLTLTLTLGTWRHSRPSASRFTLIRAGACPPSQTNPDPGPNRYQPHP